MSRDVVSSCIAYRAISHYWEIDPERIICSAISRSRSLRYTHNGNQCSDAPSLGPRLHYNELTRIDCSWQAVGEQIPKSA